MKNWKKVLKADPTNWLLEKNNYNVRYFALKYLLGFPEDHKDVKQAKKMIIKTDPVKTILKNQNPEGWWLHPKNYYEPAGKSTEWTLRHLCELGASGDHPQIKNAIEYMFTAAYKENGAFAYKGNVFFPCMNGNMLRALVAFGYLDDPRTQRVRDWLVKNQDEREGTFVCEGYLKNKEAEAKRGIRNKVSTKNCFMTTIKPLYAFSFIPEEKRSKEVKKAIKLGVEAILSKGVYKYKLNDHGNPAPKPGWLKFGFPLSYNTDILEIAYVLSKLGYAKDPRLKETVDIILRKQKDDGRWIMEHVLSGKPWKEIEKKGKPSKWITFFAMSVLKRACS